MKRNAKVLQRREFIIALAMLRGAEIEQSNIKRHNGDRLWLVHDASGANGNNSYDRWVACERWLIDHGIHVGPNCEVADLSTKIEGNLEK